MTTKERCLLKVPYPNKKAAKQAASKLRRKDRKLKPYRCKTCGNYHLTSKRDMAYTVKARIED